MIAKSTLGQRSSNGQNYAIVCQNLTYLRRLLPTALLSQTSTLDVKLLFRLVKCRVCLGDLVLTVQTAITSSPLGLPDKFQHCVTTVSLCLLIVVLFL